MTAPLRILIAALGGQGGGVLMNWIVAAAREAGWRVQATSVPGVAQRTGSTSYYIEVAPEGPDAPLNLVPVPGRVDVVLVSELVEAGRMMEAGFVSPRLTTLITSTGRAITTAEKSALGDGRYDGERVLRAGPEMAKAFHALDLDGLARTHGTFISATLFGALAGADVLPWPVEVTRGVMGGQAASLAGFDAAMAAVRDGEKDTVSAKIELFSAPIPDLPQGLDLPPFLQTVAAHGHARCCDFQDREYGRLYLERMRALCAAGGSEHALTEAARRLALWMAYEDVARVADLKTRPERFAKIRAEAGAGPGQIVEVRDYLKPRTEEIADILPAALGRRVMARVARGKSFPLLGKGRRIRANGVFGYWMLRLLAGSRRLRRRSLRFQQEQEAIEDWLAAMHSALGQSPGFAEALAELPRVQKGYSDTQARGRRAYAAIIEQIVRPALDAGPDETATGRLRTAISAALSDDSHSALNTALGAASPPILR